MSSEHRLDQLSRRVVVEAPLAFLQKQAKMRLRDAVVPAQVTLGLVSKVLDPVDMLASAIVEPLLLIVW